jgi:hypothetical protein
MTAERNVLNGSVDRYLPWVLNGASADMRTKVLGLLPPPARVLYRRVWEPVTAAPNLGAIFLRSSRAQPLMVPVPLPGR